MMLFSKTLKNKIIAVRLLTVVISQPTGKINFKLHIAVYTSNGTKQFTLKSYQLSIPVEVTVSNEMFATKGLP